MTPGIWVREIKGRKWNGMREVRAGQGPGPRRKKRRAKGIARHGHDATLTLGLKGQQVSCVLLLCSICIYGGNKISGCDLMENT